MPNRKTTTMKIRISPEDKEKIRTQAAVKEESMSEYMIRRSLEPATRP